MVIGERGHFNIGDEFKVGKRNFVLKIETKGEQLCAIAAYRRGKAEALRDVADWYEGHSGRFPSAEIRISASCYEQEEQ